ncbi:MAG: YbhB/YbcL family Raf kinase inhibitor-like protein [Candidatus Gracilibacteria bacterium]
MNISSTAFQEGQTLPAKYTCQGDDINPPLNFAEVPETAKSLALIVDDPDAPSGTWTHWTAWNIDPSQTQINEDSVPKNAIEGTTSWGSAGWKGPCPPSGSHRYYFKLYALDQMLNLNETAKVDELLKAMDGHIIDKASLQTYYQKHASAKQ